MRDILVVLRKELIDMLRDRRTLIAMVLVPLLLFPVIITVTVWVVRSQVEEASEKTLQVALVNDIETDSLSFGRYLQQAEGVKLVTGLSADSARARVQRGVLDAAYVLDPSFADAVTSQRPGRLDFVYKSGDDAEIIQRRLQGAVEAYEQDLLNARFAALGLSTEATRAVEVQEVDLATQKEQLAQEIGGLLPYMFILFCFIGCMYPAIDMGAGEKERGTLETLLSAPTSRLSILAGKCIATTLAGLASAVISIVGIVLTLQFAADLPDSLVSVVYDIVAPGTVAIVLSLLVPLTIFFAATQLALSFFAGSFKEAQSMISPLSFAVIIPAFIALLPGMKLTATTALIPILNVSLATKEVIGGTASGGLLLIVYASLIVLAVLSLVVCMQLFRQERVIFRS